MPVPVGGPGRRGAGWGGKKGRECGGSPGMAGGGPGLCPEERGGGVQSTGRGAHPKAGPRVGAAGSGQPGAGGPRSRWGGWSTRGHREGWGLPQGSRAAACSPWVRSALGPSQGTRLIPHRPRESFC